MITAIALWILISVTPPVRYELPPAVCTRKMWDDELEDRFERS